MVTKEQVKKCLDKFANDYLSTREETECFDYAIKVVDEHKTGIWIIGNYGFICSLCGTEERKNHFPKYCPECGAKMERAETEAENYLKTISGRTGGITQ